MVALIKLIGAFIFSAGAMAVIIKPVTELQPQQIPLAVSGQKMCFCTPEKPEQCSCVDFAKQNQMQFKCQLREHCGNFDCDDWYNQHQKKGSNHAAHPQQWNCQQECLGCKLNGTAFLGQQAKLLKQHADKMAKESKQNKKNVKSTSERFIKDDIPAYCKQVFSGDKKQVEDCIRKETANTKRFFPQRHSNGSIQFRPHKLAIGAVVVLMMVSLI